MIFIEYRQVVSRVRPSAISWSNEVNRSIACWKKLGIRTVKAVAIATRKTRRRFLEISPHGLTINNKSPTPKANRGALDCVSTNENASGSKPAHPSRRAHDRCSFSVQVNIGGKMSTMNAHN